jgi:hypothetical protein
MGGVQRIGLESLKEEVISQLMREVDLAKRSSYPSIVKYEGVARYENRLSTVLKCVVPFPLVICPTFPLLLHIPFCYLRIY